MTTEADAPADNSAGTGKPTLVVSAPNLTEGGPLRILRDCVAVLAEKTDQVATIVVLHDAALIPDYPGITKIVHARAKQSWLRRMIYEYVDASSIARSVRADIWLSLHDITSRVPTPVQYVYCHNPSPFYRLGLREALLEPKFALFNAFYGRLYGLGIRRNRAVIVQQEWIKQEFADRYRPPRVVTAWPHIDPPETAPQAQKGPSRTFLFPSFPRVFKNFEVLCDAVRLLSRDGSWNGEVRMTIDGSESRYARTIKTMAADLPAIKLIGLQDKAGMEAEYARADAVLFPSKLETWGLPISEARERGKTIILADLPYARETLGTYDGAVFVDPGRPEAWASAMRDAAAGSLVPDPPTHDPVEPDFRTWDALVDYIIGPGSRMTRHAAANANG